MLKKQERRHEQRFDKVFSVYINSPFGSAFGIVRNISEGGMFIETNDPYPLGSRMKITFSRQENDTEMTALAEVAHLCLLNQTAAGGNRESMIGMGVRFIGFEQEGLQLTQRNWVELQ
jgi:hypothetical protein